MEFLLLNLVAEMLHTPAEALDRMQVGERTEGEEEQDGKLQEFSIEKDKIKSIRFEKKRTRG